MRTSDSNKLGLAVRSTLRCDASSLMILHFIFLPTLVFFKKLFVPVSEQCTIGTKPEMAEVELRAKRIPDFSTETTRPFTMFPSLRSPKCTISSFRADGFIVARAKPSIKLCPKIRQGTSWATWNDRSSFSIRSSPTRDACTKRNWV